jgi:hypothetical protein
MLEKFEGIRNIAIDLVNTPTCQKYPGSCFFIKFIDKLLERIITQGMI